MSLLSKFYREGGILHDLVVIAGIFLAKILGLPGIGGFIVGLLFKRFLTAFFIGGFLGIIEHFLLMSIRYIPSDITSFVVQLIIAILVAVLMTTVGWCIQRLRKSAKRI